MSDAATQIIDAFTALPASERYAVFVELVRISEAGPLTDDELIAAGDELFLMYDRMEASIGDSQAG